MEKNPQINKDLFYHLARHHSIVFPPDGIYNSELPILFIEDGRTFKIEGNKKYLKHKLLEEVEFSNPELINDDNIGSTNKTIKHFLESASKIRK